MKKARLAVIRRMVLALLLAGVCIVRFCPGAGEWYSLRLYPSLSYALSLLASAVPFSLDEVLVLAAVTGIVVGILGRGGKESGGSG